MRHKKYIFILIVLAGLFGLGVSVTAEDLPKGQCTVYTSSGTTVFQGPTTEDECNAKKSFGGVTYSTKWLASNVIPEKMLSEALKSDTDPEISDEDIVAQLEAQKQRSKDANYQLLAPLPCEESKDGPGCEGGELRSFNTAQRNNLGVYLNLMIKLFIGLCAVLAVVMIVVGGLEYMTSELVHSKEAGKARITQAILGLLIALGAYALLYTINPDLLKTDIETTLDATS